MGEYVLTLRGQQASRDARISAELVHRTAQGAEASLAKIEGAAGQGVTGGQSGDMNLTLNAPAIASVCGDKLVLKLSSLSGSSSYPSVYVTLTTP